MSSQVATSDESKLTDTALPSDYGLFSGVTAYLLGFGVVYASMAREVESALSAINTLVTFFGEAPIPAWKAVGWLFYNAHLVAVEIPMPGGTVSRDFIATEGASVALYFLPPALLIGAGYLVARQADHLPDVRAGVGVGATIVVGYLLVAIGGAFVLSASAFGATVGPDLLGAAAIAGLLYPLIFGSLGGAIAALVP